MKTRRTRILIVVIAASIVVAIFMDWNEAAQGFRDGWNSRLSSPFEKPAQVMA
jgi:hypothetical protein